MTDLTAEPAGAPGARIRVVHVITTLSTGGAEMMLCKLLSMLSGEEFENTVVSLMSGGDLEQRVRDTGARIETLGMRAGLPDPVALVRLWRIIRQSDPHVLQTWLYHADLVGFLVGRAAGVPAIAWNIHCSDMGADYYRGVSGIMVTLLAALSSRPEAIVVNSAAGRAAHQALGYTSSRWRIIRNGFDPEHFRPDAEARSRVRREMGVSYSTPLIGLVARFDAVKGHAIFLRAAEILSEFERSTVFVLVGRGCESGNPAITNRR